MEPHKVRVCVCVRRKRTRQQWVGWEVGGAGRKEKMKGQMEGGMVCVCMFMYVCVNDGKQEKGHARRRKGNDGAYS